MPCTAIHAPCFIIILFPAFFYFFLSGTQKELDYVFASGATPVAREIDRCAEDDPNAGWQQVSDHAAIVATFTV